MADADEAPGQDVQGKAADELYPVQGYGLDLGATTVILVTEGHLPIRYIGDPMVADGYLVSIAADVLNHAWGPIKGLLAYITQFFWYSSFTREGSI